MMRTVVGVALAAAALGGAADAQPLEQNFAFGAPLSVLGNDQFADPRIVPRSRLVSGPDRREVRVRFGRTADPRAAQGRLAR